MTRIIRVFKFNLASQLFNKTQKKNSGWGASCVPFLLALNGIMEYQGAVKKIILTQKLRSFGDLGFGPWVDRRKNPFYDPTLQHGSNTAIGKFI